jgi:hypothetical protein
MDPNYNQQKLDIQKHNEIDIKPPVMCELTEEYLLQEAIRVMKQVKNLQKATTFSKEKLDLMFNLTVNTSSWVYVYELDSIICQSNSFRFVMGS